MVRIPSPFVLKLDGLSTKILSPTFDTLGEIYSLNIGGDWNSVIEECGVILKRWNKEVYSVSQQRMGWLLKRLKVVRKMPTSPIVIEEVRRVEKEL